MGRRATTASGLPRVAVTVRLDRPDLERMVAIADAAGVSPQAWMREVLVAGASPGPTPVIRGETEPVVAGAGVPKQEPSACEHPKSARRQLGYATKCDVCGAKIR